VPPLGIVSDGVSGSQADPLRDGAILLLRFGKLLLGSEGFVARHLEDLGTMESSGFAMVRIVKCHRHSGRD